MSANPKIVVFACKWGPYADADIAGQNGQELPANVRVINADCSGQINPNLVLEALRLGADGVAIMGCKMGDCHYVNGNFKAKENFERLERLTHLLGIDSRRVRSDWFSVGDGTRWTEFITQFTNDLKELKEGSKVSKAG